MSDLVPPGPHTTLRRNPERGAHDRATIDRILDEALICHVAFVDADQPLVIPTIHARIGDRLYLHGAARSRMLAVLAGGAAMSLCASLVDGLVLARSAFRHSLNYRSVVVVGRAVEVTAESEKRAALDALVEHVMAGRSREARAASAAELAATRVVALPLDAASAKIRRGPPVDLDRDLDLPVWAGELPLARAALPPRPDPRQGDTPPASPALTAYCARAAAAAMGQ